MCFNYNKNAACSQKVWRRKAHLVSANECTLVAQLILQTLFTLCDKEVKCCVVRHGDPYARENRWSLQNCALFYVLHVSRLRRIFTTDNYIHTQTSAYLNVSAKDLWMEWQTCSTVTPLLRIKPSSKSGGCPGFFVYTLIKAR